MVTPATIRNLACGQYPLPTTTSAPSRLAVAIRTSPSVQWMIAKAMSRQVPSCHTRDALLHRMTPTHHQRPKGSIWPDQLCRGKGRHIGIHQGAGAGGRVEGDHRQCRGPGLHRHRHGRRRTCPGSCQNRVADTGRRLGHDSEIAHVARFLAGDEAAFITGSTLTANGGQYMT